jgi:virginiamycin B lyase
MPSSETFDIFMFPRIYPSSLDFDSTGNIYVSGFGTKSIWFGEVAKMKNGTSEGISEVKLPLDGFAGYDEGRIGGGSVAVDNERNAVWTALVSFPEKGQLFRYDIESKKVDTYDTPPELKAPSSVALDNSGNLWVTDHGSSTFFMLDPTTGNTTSFVTSIASPKIFGGQTPPNAYTLPYWIKKGPDGSIWFNEHVGNKIAEFDPREQTLVEYWIPTQNPLWASCPPNAERCGLANALQFAVGQDGQVWFTEWTENKIGRVDAAIQLPFSINATPEITVARGDSAEIKITKSGSGDFDGRMMASGTFTRTGVLGNSTGIFSQESVSVSADNSKQFSYTFTPAEDLAAGEYVIMVGAENDDVSVMKAVKVNIV